jgi:hypothetical protein
MLIIWGQKQMDMIGHQDVSMQSTTAVICAFTQYVEIHEIVASAGKARNPIVSSLDDMERYRRQDKAARTWHGESGSDERRDDTESSSDDVEPDQLYRGIRTICMWNFPKIGL